MLNRIGGDFMIAITEEIYDRTVDLPIEEKIKLVDKLLLDITPQDPSIENAWIMESEKRLKKYRSGEIRSISGDEVFQKINKKLNNEL